MSDINIVELLAKRMSQIEEQINMTKNVMLGHNSVVQTDGGLYLKREGEAFAPTQIEFCSRWSPEDAAQLADEFNATDVHGRTAKVVLLREALAAEYQDVARLHKLTAALEGAKKIQFIHIG